MDIDPEEMSVALCLKLCSSRQPKIGIHQGVRYQMTGEGKCGRDM